MTQSVQSIPAPTAKWVGGDIITLMGPVAQRVADGLVVDLVGPILQRILPLLSSTPEEKHFDT